MRHIPVYAITPGDSPTREKGLGNLMGSYQHLGTRIFFVLERDFLCNNNIA